MSEILISVIIPCRNEEKYISPCLNSLLQQKNLNGSFEIIVVDGMSNDDTRDILNRLSNDNEKISVLLNEQKYTPFALNMGIKNSKGRYIVIMGAHSVYDKYYLASCLKLFEQHPEVSCVGGPIKSIGMNNIGRAIATAMSHPIGVGNAKHRFPDYEGYAEMACFPMFKREVFKEIGLYDESLIKNQDDEFCFRLRQNNKYIYISPRVQSEYVVRSSFSSLFMQYYLYGYYRVAVIRKYKIPISYRQIVPPSFFITIFALLVLAIVLGRIWIGLLVPIIYIISIVFVAIISKKIKPGLKLFFIYSVFILHISYSAGFLRAIYETFIIRKVYGFIKRSSKNN